MRVWHWLDRTEEILSALCILAMSLIIAAQVFHRYVLGSSLLWSEELGRYLLIWGVYIGCAYAVRDRRHLAVTVVLDLVPDTLRRWMLTLADILTLVFCGVIVVWGIDMLEFLGRTGQKAPSLGVAIYWVYLVIPIGAALMGLRVLQGMWNTWVKGDLRHADAEV